MAIRYLEVEISRRQYTTVFLQVDDEMPGWEKAFKAGVQGRLMRSAILECLDDAIEAIVCEGDWGEGGRAPEVDTWSEVGKRPGVPFPVYEVPPPTPAEQRVLRERAGQLRLGQVA